MLLITMTSADSPLGCPSGVSPGKNALLPGTTAVFTYATEPPTSLCCASSSHHVGLHMRFLSIGPPVSSSLPSPEPVTLPELASSGRLFMFP
jgi:hypothetical protein